MSNVPIHLARDHGCDVIIILKFKCAGEGPVAQEYNQWISGLQRFVDILVDEKARTTQRDYEFFNNDLEQEDKINQARELLKSCLRRHQGTGNTEIEEAARLLSEVKLSASGKRKIKLVIVDSEEIPEFHFSNFDKNALRESINIGYQSFFNIKNKIAEAIGL